MRTWSNYLPHDVISFILKNNQTKSLNKRPIGLIGYLDNCTLAFEIYIHVHYNDRANAIILIFRDFLISQFF